MIRNRKKRKVGSNLFEEIIGDSVVVAKRNSIIDLDFPRYGVDVDLHRRLLGLRR